MTCLGDRYVSSVIVVASNSSSSAVGGRLAGGAQIGIVGALVRQRPLAFTRTDNDADTSAPTSVYAASVAPGIGSPLRSHAYPSTGAASSPAAASSTLDTWGTPRTDGAGPASATLTVAAPAGAPFTVTVMLAVSCSSCAPSSSASNVAVANDAPAASVDAPGTSRYSSASRPDTASATGSASANVTPFAIATVSVAAPPSSIVAGCAVTSKRAASLSLTVTVTAAPSPTV